MKKKVRSVNSLVKKRGSQLILSIVTASIFAGSCNVPEIVEAEYNNQDNIYGTTRAAADVGLQFLNIEELNVDEDLANYIVIMRDLFDDITSDSMRAAQFCANPEEYLSQEKFQKYNHDLSIFLSENDKRILLALSDPEVIEAAQSDDLRQFIRICYAKQLLTQDAEILSENIVSAEHYFKSKDDYLAVKEYVSSDQFVTQLNINKANVNTEAMAIVAAIVVAVVADEYVLDRVRFWGAMENTFQEVSHTLSREPVLRFWQENNEAIIDKTVLYDELISTRARNIAKIIAEEIPTINEGELCDFLALNLQHYYALSNK